MKVFEVKFSWTMEVPPPDATYSNLEETADAQDQSAELTAVIHLGAEDIFIALSLATEYLDNEIGEEQYEILHIAQVENLFIVNWPGDNEECSCPFCRAKHLPDEDVLVFSCCACGTEIKVANDGWESTECPECGGQIDRDKIIGSNGHYILLKVGNRKQE